MRPFRLSTVVNCDRILVLSEGRVVESGSHAHLLADPTSHYAGINTFTRILKYNYIYDKEKIEFYIVSAVAVPTER